MMGDLSRRRKRLRIAMLWPSFFLGGRRSRASCFSDGLRYLTFVVSGRSGNVHYIGN
jgi:hypothetical protein